MKKQFYTTAILLMVNFAAKAQVGIGTPTPVASAMLDVTSTTKGLLYPRMTTANRTAIASPAAGLQVFDTTTNTNWYFNGTVWVNDGAAAVTANNGLTLTAGNVQLGGTLIQGTTITQAANQLSFGTASNGSIDFNNAAFGGIMMRVNAAAGKYGFNQSGSGLFAIDNSGTVGGRFMILENGNLGINQSVPVTKLDVRGSGAAYPVSSGTTQSVGQYVRFHDNTNLVLDMGGSAGNGNWIQSTDQSNLGLYYPLLLNPNGGNLGVRTGTGTPGHQLSFGSDGGNYAKIALAEFGATNSMGIGYSAGQFRFNVGSGTDKFSWLGSETSTTDLMSLTGTGALTVVGTITAPRIQGPSDQRFKKNIKPIENALDKVMKLGGYTYDWKDASEFPSQTLGKGHDMGVIAQEVEKQFPEAVTTNADGYKAVSYTELVPVLIEAIKSQQSQMQEAMKAQQIQIDELKNEVARLKK